MGGEVSSIRVNSRPYGGKEVERPPQSDERNGFRHKGLSVEVPLGNSSPGDEDESRVKVEDWSETGRTGVRQVITVGNYNP